MPTQKPESFHSGSDVLPPREPRAKPAFIKPKLIYHGSVVDLTTQFGGSLTPQIDRDDE
jgi:hypothetical protein